MGRVEGISELGRGGGDDDEAWAGVGVRAGEGAKETAIFAFVLLGLTLVVVSI